MNSSTIKFDTPLLNEDGSTFDGYLVFLAVPPASNQIGADGQLFNKLLTLNRSNPPTVVPMWHLISINNGVVGNDAKVWKTGAYAPKGVKYKAFLFDKGNNKIEGPLNLPQEPFVLTSGTYNMDIGPIVDRSVDGIAGELEKGKESYFVTILGGKMKIYNDTVTVENNYTYDYPVQSDGSLLIVEFITGGSGGYTLTFSDSFLNPITALPDNVGERLSQIFRSNGEKWCIVGTA